MVVLVYGVLAMTVGGIVGFGVGKYWALLIPPLIAVLLWWGSEPDQQSDLQLTAFLTTVIFGVSGVIGGLSLRRATTGRSR